MTAPTPQLAEPAPPQLLTVPPGTAYSLPYITLSNVQPNPTATAFSVTYLTSVACITNVSWSAITGQAQAGISSPDTATTTHSITITPSSPAAVGGQQFAFSINLDATDTTGLSMPSYTSYVQLTGARTTTNGKALTTRFFNFGGTPPAPSGGGGNGNWNTYTWAQWNPKNTAFPN
jgi:hypothetical protein